MFKKGEQKNVHQEIDTYISENISLKILKSKKIKKKKILRSKLHSKSNEDEYLYIY